MNRPRSATERVWARRALRSALTKVFAAAYRSECRPGGPYGALKLIVFHLKNRLGAEHQPAVAAVVVGLDVHLVPVPLHIDE